MDELKKELSELNDKLASAKDNGKCKHPNVMDTDLVHHYKDDGAHPVMERYGHGRNIAFQIWLESPYIAEHWNA